MAAVSQTATTLSPGSNPHGPGYSWDIQAENSLDDNKTSANDENAYPPGHASLTPQNGNSASYAGNTTADAIPRKHSHGETRPDMRRGASDTGYLSPSYPKEFKARSLNENASPADSLLDLYDGAKEKTAEDGTKRTASEMSPNPELDDSKWIHRDKLAKIENEELQAAGIFLPRTRDRARSKSQNRPRRDQSQDKVNGQERSRKNSAATGEPRTPDLSSVPSWDLRCPEEIAEGGFFASNGGGNGSTKGTSRIPVAKLSPVPIPSEHLERDTLLVRKRENSPTEEDSISYPKPRVRSGSTGNALSKPSTNGTGPQYAIQHNRRVDSSPKKGTTTTGARKQSGPKPANGGAGRPKTRGGPSKDSTSTGGGTTRPSTRSGELSPSNSKQMEGEPPWMVSAYRPDPRLPPDQQLLPTVAKRLQQEKWEREGKFGSIYDKEFRPLTDEGFLKPPEIEPMSPEQEDEKEAREEQADWPLKPEPKNLAPTNRAGSYSTMPKISDKPPMSPIPSPRTPSQPPQPRTAATRVPEPPEETAPQKKSAGCGCCIIM